jgi:hypothetical protein
MVLRAVRRNSPQHPEPCEVVEICPLCGGKMETVYSRPHQQVCACVDCQTTITVPVVAWDIARVKRKTRIVPSKK